MEKFTGYDDIQVNEGFVKLPAGGYKCFIKQAKFEAWKNGNGQSLVLCIDIKEGEYKDYYKKDFEGQTKDKKWRGLARIGVPTNSSSDGMKKAFKSFVTALENSNKGFSFPWGKDDAETCKLLKDKLIGFVFGEEEYYKNDGSIGVSVKPFWPRSYDKVLDAEAPQRKTVQGGAPQQASGSSTAWTPNTPTNNFEDDDDLPF